MNTSGYTIGFGINMNNDPKVRLITHDVYPPDARTEKILYEMADADGVIKPVVALPDIHFKHSYHTPTGVVVMTKDRIIPKFINANCGMSFIKTPFFDREINDTALDKIFNYLRKNIAVSTRSSPLINNADLKEIVRKGAEWSIDRYGLCPDDLANFENNGSLLKDDPRGIDEIMSYIPDACQQMGLLSWGVLGYGNHFVELHVVEDIVNSDIAQKFNISKGQICFMIHGDSRAFGQSIFDFYSGKAKKLFGLQQIYKKLHYKILSSPISLPAVKSALSKVNYYLNRAKSTVYWKMDGWNRKRSLSFSGFDAKSKEGVAYLTSTYCAIDYGYANRAYMASIIRDALRNALNSDTAGVNILYDGNHDALQREVIDGDVFYAHRNGAARALPASYFKGHPVFSYTGQPILLPSSLGSPSYLCAVTKGCRDSYYSSCHGTGRVIERGQARQLFTAKDVFENMKGKNVKIYDYGKGNTSEEAPGAFKDVEKILESVMEHGIAEPVAMLMPLASLKGWR
ncbi:MAG: hypothetical protein A3K16_05110 [Omnitrophica bacterium RIFCSPLOWO2_01_FULL_45_24]|nr:MAG: hypothetical protein A3K16_05110 [Omnitrophica bacterium RIFCSPLOWO2_01_FULL_45_24]